VARVDTRTSSILLCDSIKYPACVRRMQTPVPGSI
jgi:hypothetical protein